MIICALIAVGLTIAIGALHNFYLDIYEPTDDDSSSMTPQPMPMETLNNDINHHMLITLSQNVTEHMAESFGTLPQDMTGTGFLSAAEKRWSDPTSPQLRRKYDIPPGANVPVETSSIPFATVEILNDCSKETEEGKQC